MTDTVSAKSRVCSAAGECCVHDYKFVIEIGCGVGLHPILWAKNNPRGKILAIERTRIKFNKFHARLLKHAQLKNIFSAHADATHLLPHLDINNKVDEYYILYPNPYPKNRHKNLRLAHSHLIEFLISSLKSNGLIVVATNLKYYADELRNFAINNINEVVLISDSTIPKNNKPRTHFEKKYLLRGDICYELVFRRK